MTRLPLLLAVLALTAGGATPAAQDAPPAPKPPGAAFGAETTAILVDVVVRDRQGRPITDLTEKDFELYEDDVRQEIATITLVTPEGPSERTQPRVSSTSPTSAPERPVTIGPAFVALVFDRLSPEGRALAHKGALTYLETAQPHEFAGVFQVDLALNTVQPYTTDREKVKAAIDAVATKPPATFARGQGRTTTARGSLNPGTPVVAGAEEHGRAPVASQPPAPGGPAGGQGEAFAIAQQISDQIGVRMERSYDALMEDQQGHATTSSLLALVDSLGMLPGRKTVVFFAEGVAIPPNVQSKFDSVVATANLANVSIYTVDAAGLRVHSKAAETASELQALGAIGIGDVARDDSQPYMRDLELNETLLRSDPSVGLKMLADRTGGFLINNTNDLQRGFRQIDMDRRFHYLLTYTPKNIDFKGEFRRIAVRVPTRRVIVRSRSGYLAVKAQPGGGPLMAYEGPMLALLDRSPLPKELPISGGAFSFPDPARPGLVGLIVSAEPAALTFRTDPATKQFEADFAILARIRSRAGDVVFKTSEPYRLNGPADQVDAAKRGEVLFFRQPLLAPGEYTLDYIVHDALGSKAGAGSESFAVLDKPAQSLQVSSLIVVERTERVPEGERDPNNPLYYQDLLLYPNLGTPLSKARDKTLSFALAVYGARPGATATLELRQGTNALGQVSVPVPAPDPNGRIQLASQLPLEAFPAGEYTLQLTVASGGEKEVRTAAFAVSD